MLLTVTFGDRPSGVIATTALRKTVELRKDTYPKAAEMIERNSYIDDLLKSVESEGEARQLVKDVEAMLATGRFKVKHWIFSCGTQNSWEKEELKDIKIVEVETERVLGMVWAPQEDIFTFKVWLNFCVKNRGIDTEPNLKKESIRLQKYSRQD